MLKEWSGFFDAMNVNGAYDRVYYSEDFANYFATFISNGVFAKPSDQLKISPAGGLGVNVKTGKAYINGRAYTLMEDGVLTFNPNTTGNTIKNRVVCEYIPSDRDIKVHIEENVIDLLPEDSNKLVLCTFSLPVGANEITAAMITDTRPDKQYCGFVTGLVDQIDINTLLEQDRAQFNEWFDSMKGQLSEDAAGSLLQKIENIPVFEPSKDTNKPSLIPVPPEYSFENDKMYALTSNPILSDSKDGWVKIENLPYYFKYKANDTNSYYEDRYNEEVLKATCIPSLAFDSGDNDRYTSYGSSFCRSPMLDYYFHFNELTTTNSNGSFKAEINNNRDFRSFVPIPAFNKSGEHVHTITNNLYLQVYSYNLVCPYVVFKFRLYNSTSGMDCIKSEIVPIYVLLGNLKGRTADSILIDSTPYAGETVGNTRYVFIFDYYANSSGTIKILLSINYWFRAISQYTAESYFNFNFEVFSGSIPSGFGLEVSMYGIGMGSIKFLGRMFQS